MYYTSKDKQKNFQIPSTHKDFLQCELGEVPSKIRKPIDCKQDLDIAHRIVINIYPKPSNKQIIHGKVGEDRIWQFSHSSGIECGTLLLSISLCSHGFYPFGSQSNVVQFTLQEKLRNQLLL